MRVLQHGLTLERSASTSRRVCLLEKTQPPHRGRPLPHKLTGYECRRWCYGEHIYLVSIEFSALRCASSDSPNAVEFDQVNGRVTATEWTCVGSVDCLRV